MKTVPTTKALAALRKEMAALKKEVTQLRKASAKATQPGRVRATKVTVDSLEVVDAYGKVVASITGKGHLFCDAAWVGTGNGQRGVFLGGPLRKVMAGTLELIEPNSKHPSLVAKSWPSKGEITLYDMNSKQKLHLQGNGAPIMAYSAKTGKATVTLGSNGTYGGTLQLSSAEKDNYSRVELRGRSPNGTGDITLRDGTGTEVGKLP
jgi:hypothetical protein